MTRAIDPWAIGLILLIRVVATPDPLGAAQQRRAPLELKLEAAVMTIGRNDGLPGHALHRIAGGFRLDDGTIVVADGASNEIRLFDATGRLIRALGGAGAGPESFVALHAVWLSPPDSIVAFDLGANRLVWWMPDGRFGRSVTMDSEHAQAILARLGDGTYLGIRLPGQRRMPSGTSRVDSVRLVRMDRDGQHMHDIARLPWQIWHAVMHPVANRTFYNASPFDPTGVAAAYSNRVYYAWGGESQVRRFSTSGAADRAMPLPMAGMPLSTATWNDWIETRAAADRANSAMIRRTLQSLPRPSTQPVLDRLFVDDEGLLWIREFAAPGARAARWRVFDDSGTERARLDVPEAFKPLHIGVHHVLAVITDDAGVEIVAVFDKPRLGR
jgi:hypothetical protein